MKVMYIPGGAIFVFAEGGDWQVMELLLEFEHASTTERSSKWRPWVAVLV